MRDLVLDRPVGEAARSTAAADDQSLHRLVVRTLEAWLGVRRGVLYGFFLWGITLKVDPAVTSKLLERLGTAAADHDVFVAMG